jgi:hypothetical protein
MRPVVSRLNYTEFQELWFTVNRLCIVAVAFGITLLAGLSRWRDQALLTVLIAAASVTTYSMFTGQNILVALTFALAATLAWQSSAPLWLGGVFAACAWACKTWCVSLVVLCFLLRGPRAGAMTSVVLGFVMVVLPELVMPGALMDDYHMLTLALSVISVPAFNNISILSNFERLSDSSWSTHLHEWIPHAAHPALRTLALSLTTVLFLPGVLIWRRRRASVRYACAAYLAFMLLPLGVCWTHYFVFALPLACMCCFGDHRSRTLRALGLALLMLLCGIMDYLEDGDSPLWNFVFQPSAYPVKQSAVVVFVVITCFAALGLAPRETHQQLPTSRAG